MRLSGHTVLITGGSSGIGLALARAFRERGNEVMICGRRPERLAAAATEISGLLTERCNVADEDELRRLVRAVAERLGGLSILVNNAGVQFKDDYARSDPEPILPHVDQEIAVNLVGLVKLTALAMPLLRRAPDGAVVHVSSILAMAPKQTAPVYCATKAAVRSFSKALRYQLEEGAPTVRVFEVLPPLVDTEMTRGRSGRKLSPEAVADAVMDGMAGDRYEIRVGATRLMAAANRVSPRLAERLLRRR